MTTKTVSISNEAAKSLSPTNYEEIKSGGGAGKTRRKQPRKYTIVREGGAMSPGTEDQLVSTRVPGTDSSHAVGLSSKMTEEGAPIGAIAPAAAVPMVTGGSKEPKVHLAKTYKKAKVVLAPSAQTKKKGKTEAKKKSVKMLKMNLTGFTRKLKKASGIHKSAKEKTLKEIKEILIKMELVNKETKAPEDVLRQIYSDVETMKKRAL
jgi:hypothetical protein